MHTPKWTHNQDQEDSGVLDPGRSLLIYWLPPESKVLAPRIGKIVTHLSASVGRDSFHQKGHVC